MCVVGLCAFACSNSGQCLPSTSRCNYYDDCGDNSDEANCNLPTGLPLYLPLATFTKYFVTVKEGVTFQWVYNIIVIIIKLIVYKLFRLLAWFSTLGPISSRFRYSRSVARTRKAEGRATIGSYCTFYRYSQTHLCHTSRGSPQSVSSWKLIVTS